MFEWNDDQKAEVAQAVEDGIRAYLASRRDRIDAFVDKTFSLPHAWRLNKKAFGWDMLKTPVNILWAPPHFLLSGMGNLLLRATGQRFGSRLARLSSGFQTAVERELAWRIYSEFLELPYADGQRTYSDNRLLAMILEQPKLAPIFDESLAAMALLQKDVQGKQRLTDQLMQYVNSRKAASDLSSALISMAAGYIANKSINLGAVSLGTVLASTLAHYAAVSGFVLGSTLGSVYYSVFSVTASKTAIVLSSGGVAVVLGIVSAYTGIITDPVQRSLGWHQKRLHRVIDNLESELLSQSEQSKSFKDSYIARVLDIADVMISLTLK
jgi:hypothetical protein